MLDGGFGTGFPGGGDEEDEGDADYEAVDPAAAAVAAALHGGGGGAAAPPSGDEGAAGGGEGSPDLIARRTRAHVSLVDLELEQLEKCLAARAPALRHGGNAAPHAKAR